MDEKRKLLNDEELENVTGGKVDNVLPYDPPKGSDGAMKVEWNVPGNDPNYAPHFYDTKPDKEFSPTFHQEDNQPKP